VSDEIQIRVVDKSNPASWAKPEDWTLAKGEIALVLASRDMLVFGCGQYRGQVSQYNSRKWSFRVWDACGGRTLIKDIEQGKRRAVSQCVSALAIISGILKQDATTGEWKESNGN
jgi:hypothetical protein